eukprot:SAG31_NODE_1424_length_8394_cov_3.211814_4_plen_398_part_00
MVLMLHLPHLLVPLLAVTVDATTQLVNPVPLFDRSGIRMDAHDGTIHQWEEHGPFYYYAMGYSRCAYDGCWTPNCSHTDKHTVNVWRSTSLENRSWEFLGEALPVDSRPKGIYFRAKVQYNPRTKLYVLIVNFGADKGTPGHPYAPAYTNLAATSTTPHGPFTDIKNMSHLKYGDSGDFGFFVDVNSTAADGFPLAYLIYGGSGGNVVEILDENFTDGTGQASPCLECLPGVPKEVSCQESPAMWRTSKDKYVVLTAGCTCFGMPQLEGKPYGGTGIFAYVASSPLGPYAYVGNLNNMDGNISSTACGECAANTPPFPCPAGRCALPVQLNSILRKYDGSPLALSGSLWGLNSAGTVTNILGDYAEYWQPWADVVNEDGLPKPLIYHWNISLDTGIK